MDTPEYLLKCVAFVGYDHDGIGGTCFLVSRRVPCLSDVELTYLITARHVVDQICALGKTPTIRINATEGAKFVELRDSWKFHDDNDVDIAVCPLLNTPTDEWDHLAIPWSAIEPLPVNAEDPRRFAIGEDVLIFGLFHQHSGKNRNIPIVRVGTIAAMPEEPVQAQVRPSAHPKPHALIDAYLIELRSQGGLSGSPVFIVETLESNYHKLIMPDQMYTPRQNRPVYLLGLLQGHYEPKLAAIEELDGKVPSINVGISIVVPIEKIAEIFSAPAIQDIEHSATIQASHKKVS
jgi:hypothetical protein